MAPGKLTPDMNCCVLLFLGYFMVQDLMTMKTIGRGYESGDHYFLDVQAPQAVAYSKVSTPFDLHCHLSHLSLTSLKKRYPQFHHSVDCESCQFAKHHHLPRVLSQ